MKYQKELKDLILEMYQEMVEEDEVKLPGEEDEEDALEVNKQGVTKVNEPASTETAKTEQPNANGKPEPTTQPTQPTKPTTPTPPKKPTDESDDSDMEDEMLPQEESRKRFLMRRNRK